MMSFKKLMLASAIAALSTSAFAMEAMDDSSLSSTTGQDGLAITLSTKLSLDMYLHDTDGFANATQAGAMVITGIALTDNAGTGNASLKIDLDAGSQTATGDDAILRVGISTTNATKFNLGALKVANSAHTSSTSTTWGLDASTTTATLMTLGTLSLPTTTDLLAIEMGHESTSQGAWMRVKTSIASGLSISGFSISDVAGATSGGSISFDLTVVDKGGSNLNADIKVDANSSGLQVNLATLGAAGTSGGMDVRMANLKLGSATRVGDVELIGLNLNGTTVQVTGK